MRSTFASFVLAALSVAGNSNAATSVEPYSASVWAMVQFGLDGRATDIAIVDADQYPPAFLENVKKRLAAARVPPQEVDGKPAVLKSGVELKFLVTPTESGGGTVKIEGIGIGPMPKKKYLAAYPEELKGSRGWEGEVRGTCKVNVQGRCGAIEITALPGMPESIRKYARASLEHWEFEPQTLNGQPIEGEYDVRIKLETVEGKPEDFREDRFRKILRPK